MPDARRLASRHYREQEGVCFVEGIRPALDAIESGARLEALSDASLGEVVALVPAGASPQTGAAVYIALGQPPDADA